MSASTDEYLEALYALTQDGQAASTSDIAKRLSVTPASVTEMIKKLDASGYVVYSPYKGVTLTPTGYKLAAKMARRHRLLERFLHDVLHIGTEKVHQEACAMEHSLSDETERAICQSLKAPDKCPDDEKLIPACDLGFKDCGECHHWQGNDLQDVGNRQCNVVPIAALKARQQGTVAFIRGDDKAIRRLMDLGLTPGAKIGIRRVAPMNGPVEIDVRGCKLALGDKIASNVFVEKKD
jgi:DtxR family transcriptional regulator, Mn-dependent transcriptional regulator